MHSAPVALPLTLSVPSASPCRSVDDETRRSQRLCYASVRTSNSIAMLLLFVVDRPCVQPQAMLSSLSFSFVQVVCSSHFSFFLLLLPLHTATTRRAHSPDAMKLRASGMPAMCQYRNDIQKACCAVGAARSDLTLLCTIRAEKLPLGLSSQLPCDEQTEYSVD